MSRAGGSLGLCTLSIIHITVSLGPAVAEHAALGV